MFKGRVAKIEIDYIPLSSSVSATRLNLKGVSGNILENDAYIRAVTGLESVGFETLGGALSIGGSAYTGARATDREIVFTLECYGGENEFRNKVNNLKLLQGEGPLYFRIISTEGSLLHTYGYITELTAPPFRKEREIQLTFKSPSPYFVEAPFKKTGDNIPDKNFSLEEMYLPEYTTPWRSRNEETHELDFGDSGLSPTTDVKVYLNPSNHDGTIMLSTGGAKPNIIAARTLASGAMSFGIGYDSLENRITTVTTSEIDAFVDINQISYGNPKSSSGLNLAEIMEQDWNLSLTRGQWPTPNLAYPKLNVIVNNPNTSTMSFVALVYNKVAGI